MTSPHPHPTVTRLDGAFGAELSGVDCRRPIAADVFHAIEQALLDHHVIAIRDQSLDPHQTVALSQCFGDLEPHVFDQYHHPETPLIVVLSNRLDNGKEVGLADAGSFWHSDVSYKERPAKATMLYAVEIPRAGGDTLFCDMMAAYDALPDDMKGRLEGLTAVHDYALRDVLARNQGTRAVLTEAQKQATPAVRHPVVRRHPVTGRKALYINPAYTGAIDGLSADDGERLKLQLFDHCLQDRFRLRYVWRKGDVVVWDNAAVMHAATTAELPAEHHRTLWRTIIVGGPTH